MNIKFYLKVIGKTLLIFTLVLAFILVALLYPVGVVFGLLFTCILRIVYDWQYEHEIINTVSDSFIRKD